MTTPKPANLYDSLILEFSEKTTLEDFNYKAESWNTAFKSRNYGRRTQQQQSVINQSLLPPPIRKKKLISVESKNETENKKEEEIAPIPQISNLKFPKFTLVNERQFIFVQPTNKPIVQPAKPPISRQNSTPQQYPTNPLARQINAIQRANSLQFTNQQLTNYAFQRQLTYQQNPLNPATFNRSPFTQMNAKPMANPQSHVSSSSSQATSPSVDANSDKDKTFDAEVFDINARRRREKDCAHEKQNEARFMEGARGLNPIYLQSQINRGLIPQSQSVMNMSANPIYKPAVSPLQQPPVAAQNQAGHITSNVSSPSISTAPSSPSIQAVHSQPSAAVPASLSRPPTPGAPQAPQAPQPANPLSATQQQTIRFGNTVGTPTPGMQPVYSQYQGPSVSANGQASALKQIQKVQSQFNQKNILQMTQARVQAQQTREPQVTVPYINSNLHRAQYGLVSESAQNIPVQLDRSDKTLRFTDQAASEQSHVTFVRNQAPLEWNTMRFHDSSYYTPLKVSRENRMHQNIQHSDPALNLSLVEPNIKDYENFHHPHIDMTQVLGRPFIVTYKPDTTGEEDPEIQVSPFLKHLKDLSGKRGGIILIEHTAESPIYVSNIGMASSLVTFWHRERPNDNPRTFDQSQHLTILEPDQQSPFIAEIPKCEPIQCFSCNLFNVPVAKHPVESTDFLLVRSKRKSVFYLRQINQMYCAGYLEARQRVMRPNTKDAQKFNLNFIAAILINIFRGTEQYPGRHHIQVQSVIQEFFPDVNEPRMRGVLKDFADFYREQGNGYWKLKQNVNVDQQFQKIDITPEEVCSYQSMLVGHYKLRKSGVNILTRSKRVYQQIQRLQGDLTKRVAEKIEIELMKTPWARTENFVKAFEGQVMQIQHTEDGQQIMRTKSRKGKGDQGDGSTPAPAKKQLAGTGADLRGLTLRELKEKLMSLGVQPQVIDSLGRWKQVALLRELANSKAQDGKEDSITVNFARGPRNDYAASLQKYKKVYQETFLNNLSFISSSSGTSKVTFDDGHMLDDIGLQMMREATEEEEEDSLEFLDKESQKKPRIISGGDPPELVPYGLATHKLEIDWDRLGFGGTPMRKAAKIINVSLSAEGKPIVEISWKRRPHEIAELEKLESFVNSEQSTKSATHTDDLEGHILRTRKKQLLDKLRRTKTTKNKKGGNTEVLWYIPCTHQIMLVTDPGGVLQFHITPEYYNRITTASNKFYNFMATQTRHSSSTKGKKRSPSTIIIDTKSDEESDDAPETTTFSSRSRRISPLSKFNEMLHQIVLKLMNDPSFIAFLNPVTKKEAPDYHKYIEKPMCLKDIERTIKKDEYTTVDTFYQDMSLIRTNCKTYNETRYPALYQLGEIFWETFITYLQEVRDELDDVANQIDPVLRK